jgi:hypothetical protein
VDERLRHRCHRRCGGKPLAFVDTQISQQASYGLQVRHIDVEIHPVDHLVLKHRMIDQHVHHGSCYGHRRLRSSTGPRTHRAPISRACPCRLGRSPLRLTGNPRYGDEIRGDRRRAVCAHARHVSRRVAEEVRRLDEIDGQRGAWIVPGTRISGLIITLNGSTHSSMCLPRRRERAALAEWSWLPRRANATILPHKEGSRSARPCRWLWRGKTASRRSSQRRSI